jgi:hypothetical protein
VFNEELVRSGFDSAQLVSLVEFPATLGGRSSATPFPSHQPNKQVDNASVKFEHVRK